MGANVFFILGALSFTWAFFLQVDSLSGRTAYEEILYIVAWMASYGINWFSILLLSTILLPLLNIVLYISRPVYGFIWFAVMAYLLHLGMLVSAASYIWYNPWWLVTWCAGQLLIIIASFWKYTLDKHSSFKRENEYFMRRQWLSDASRKS